MSLKKRIIIAIILYTLIYIFAILVLSEYEDNYNPDMGLAYSLESMSLLEFAGYILYKYLLNFPFTFFVWFSDKFLYLTTFFFLVNAIGIGILSNYFSTKK